jgi:hypothetical protein
MLAPMGLFGHKEEKRAKEAAAQAESDRLLALPVRELAVEIMPAFGPDGINAKSGHRQGPMEVVSWLLPDTPVKYRQPMLGPVIEALGVLEHAELLTRRTFGSKGQASTYHATRLGETALVEGTIRQQLGTDKL